MDVLTSSIEEWIKWYDELWEKRDLRMDAYPLMSSPIYTALICIGYAYVVTVVGPNFMKQRQPMNIRSFMIGYNGFQVVLSAYIFIQVITDNIFLARLLARFPTFNINENI